MAPIPPRFRLAEQEAAELLPVPLMSLLESPSRQTEGRQTKRRSSAAREAVVRNRQGMRRLPHPSCGRPPDRRLRQQERHRGIRTDSE